MTRRFLPVLALFLILSAVGCGASKADLVAQAVQATVSAMPTPTPVVVEVTQEVTVQVTQEVTREVLVTPTVSPTPSPTLTPLVTPTSTYPPEPGASRENPVPFGVEANVEIYGGNAVFRVAVVDVVRGEPATQMMLKANPFNGVPEDKSMEWMLVRMRGVCVQHWGETGSAFGSSSGMRVYANNRRVPQPMGPIEPEPHLLGLYFKDAKLEGWVAFFVYKDEPHPLLFVENSSFDSTGTWFALSK